MLPFADAAKWFDLPRSIRVVPPNPRRLPCEARTDQGSEAGGLRNRLPIGMQSFGCAFLPKSKLVRNVVTCGAELRRRPTFLSSVFMVIASLSSFEAVKDAKFGVDPNHETKETILQCLKESPYPIVRNVDPGVLKRSGCRAHIDERESSCRPL